MLVKKQSHINRIAVGCICTYKGKYFRVHRIKDRVWNSITGKVEEGETPEQAIVRELKEEINFVDAKPEYITTLYHDYDGKIVEYHLFTLEFKENPVEKLVLNKKEHDDTGLFTLKQALRLKLYEDEDYCLKLHAAKKK
jgi:mutator protein MutT